MLFPVYLGAAAASASESPAMTLTHVFFAFTLVALLILAGRFVRQRFQWIQRLY